MFILGLISFGGIAIAAAALVKKTPDAIKIQTESIEDLKKLLDIHIDGGELARTQIHEAIIEIKKVVDNLKYQHDHSDKFGFGTQKTEKELGQVHNLLIRLIAKIDVMK